MAEMAEMAEIAEMAESKKQKKGCRDYSSIIGKRSEPLSGHVNGSSRYTSESALALSK